MPDGVVRLGRVSKCDETHIYVVWNDAKTECRYRREGFVVRRFKSASRT